MSHSRSPAHSSDPVQTPSLEPQAGYIYEYPLSLEQVLLRVGVAVAADGSRLTFSQRSSVASIERRLRKTAKKGRPKSRPCLVVLLSEFGNPQVVLLSKLGDCHPTLFCATAQHYIVPVNKTPAWREDKTFKVDVKPDWPDGHCSYVLAILNPVTTPPLVQYTYNGGNPYYVDNCDEIVNHCMQLNRAARSWSATRRGYSNESYATHDVLRGKIMNLDKAHTADDLAAINLLYNDHIQAVSLANSAAWPDDRPLPADAIPERLRQYLDPRSIVSAVQRFNFDYDPRTSPAVQFDQLTKIEAEVKTMEIVLANQIDDGVLSRLLHAIVAIAVKTTATVEQGRPPVVVHPAFHSAGEPQLRSLVSADRKLRKELLSVATGFVSRADAILNYVCQEVVVG